MIKVFRIKDLIKYFIRVLIPIVVLLIILQTFSKQKNNSQSISLKTQKPLIGCISDTIAQINIVNGNTTKEEKKTRFIFLSELDIMENLKENLENNIKEDDIEPIDYNIKEDDVQNEIEEKSEENKITVEEAKTGLKTEVIDSGVAARSTNEYHGVQINNTSDKELNEDILIPNIDINKSNVIIYHTHTCESYTPTEQFNYEASGNYRSIDLNFSVARVGDELEAALGTYGINVIHDKTYHDYPAYNGSYSRSLITAQNALNNNQGTDIIIDLHRDAIADPNYAPKVKIGEEYVSQLMFVIGVNHDNWNQNLKFAVKVMEKANELYPRTF